jgi:hypothetical protein
MWSLKTNPMWTTNSLRALEFAFGLDFSRPRDWRLNEGGADSAHA